jgi:hypothetical protein
LHLPLAFLVVMLYSNTLLQLGDFTFQQMMSSIIIMIIMLVILVYVSKMDYDRITAEYLFARQRAEIQKYQYEQILKSDADAISLSKRLDMYLRKIKDVIGRSYEQTDEVDEFIRQALAENISVDSVPLQTDNLIIDSIINSQVFKARAQGFEIDCKALIPEQINTASIKDEMAYGINKLLDAAFDNGESISDRKIRILLRFQANCIFLFVLYQVDETNRKAAGELTKANRKVIDAINETFPRHRGLAHYEVAKREAVWSLMIFSD